MLYAKLSPSASLRSHLSGTLACLQLDELAVQHAEAMIDQEVPLGETARRLRAAVASAAATLRDAEFSWLAEHVRLVYDPAIGDRWSLIWQRAARNAGLPKPPREPLDKPATERVLVRLAGAATDDEVASALAAGIAH